MLKLFKTSNKVQASESIPEETLINDGKFAVKENKHEHEDITDLSSETSLTPSPAEEEIGTPEIVEADELTTKPEEQESIPIQPVEDEIIVVEVPTTESTSTELSPVTVNLASIDEEISTDALIESAAEEETPAPESENEPETVPVEELLEEILAVVSESTPTRNIEPTPVDTEEEPFAAETGTLYENLPAAKGEEEEAELEATQRVEPIETSITPVQIILCSTVSLVSDTVPPVERDTVHRTFRDVVHQAVSDSVHQAECDTAQTDIETGCVVATTEDVVEPLHSEEPLHSTSELLVVPASVEEAQRSVQNIDNDHDSGGADESIASTAIDVAASDVSTVEEGYHPTQIVGIIHPKFVGSI